MGKVCFFLPKAVSPIHPSLLFLHQEQLSKKNDNVIWLILIQPVVQNILNMDSWLVLIQPVVQDISCSIFLTELVHQFSNKPEGNTRVRPFTGSDVPHQLTKTEQRCLPVPFVNERVSKFGVLVDTSTKNQVWVFQTEKVKHIRDKAVGATHEEKIKITTI